MKQQIKRRLSVLLAVLMLIPSTVMANPEKSIESMTLETGAIPARYVVGQPVIETVGFSAIYTDTTTGSINVGVSDMYKTPDGAVPDVIFDTSESYTGKIGYNNNGDIKFSQDIEVVSKANAIESFTFTLYKDEYEIGDDVETGGTLTITYDNGWIENTTIASMGGDITFDTSGIDNTKIGHQSITASLYGTTAVSSVNYVEGAPVRVPISLDIEGYKEAYDYGDSFSDTGSIIITYNDMTKEYFALTAEYVTGFNSTTPGPQDITITKDGVSVTKTININPMDVPTPEGISVSGYDMEYTRGEQFNEIGTIAVLMSDGSVQLKDLTVDLVTGFDSSVVGSQELTVSYLGKAVTITVEVKDVAKTVTSMTFSSVKDVYNLNEEFVEIGTIEVSYSDGTLDSIPVKKEMVTIFDTSTVGTRSMIITFDGVSETLDYTVVDNNVVPVDFEVRDGFVTTVYQYMLITKVPILVTNNDGSTYETDLTFDSITDFDRNELGGQTITLHFGGISKNINVNVIPDQVDEIAIQKIINIVSGTAIETLDTPVMVTYMSGKTQIVHLENCIITGLDTNIAGIQKATVTFEGVSENVTFDVELKYADKVFASIHSDKIIYAPVGSEALDIPLECIVIYTDGSSEMAYPSAFNVVNRSIEDSTTEGIKTINIDIMPEGEIESQRIQGLVILTNDAIRHGSDATIEITKVEGQKEFELFEELGETVLITITDGTFSKTINALHSMVANIDFDTRTVGDKVAEFTVAASDFYQYAYKVVGVPEDEFEGAVLTWGTQPIIQYTLNQAFYDNTNVVLTKTNGQEARFTLGECEVTGFDSSKPGVQTITVKLAGKVLTYEVTVLDGTSAVESVAISGETREFKLGATFDYKGAVRVRYENGTELIKTLKECSVTGFDSSTEGNKTIMVTFGGESVTYSVKIVKPVISGGGSSGGGSGSVKPIAAPPVPPAPPAPVITQPIFIELPTIVNMRAPEITAESIKTLNSFVVPPSVGSQIELPSNMGVISVEGKTVNFVDIKNHWAGGTINAAVERGLLNGVSENRFAPKAELTLEQTLVGLNNVMLKNNLIQMKLQKEYVTDKFKSMLEDKTWSTLAVVQTLGNTDLETVDRIAENTNVLKGVITRGELANLLQKLTADLLEAGYMEPEEFCKSFGFMVGDADGNFAANRELSRAELASILLRVDNKIMNA